MDGSTPTLSPTETTMHILLLILFFVFLHRIIRLFTRGSFRRNPYGYRRHRFGGGLLTILGLVALDRIFSNRRW